MGYVLLKDTNLVADVVSMIHETIYMKRKIRVMVCRKKCKGQRSHIAKRPIGRKTKQNEKRKRGIIRNNNATKKGRTIGLSKREHSEKKKEKKKKRSSRNS